MKIPSEAELVKMRFQSLTLRLGRHAIHHMEKKEKRKLNEGGTFLTISKSHFDEI